MASKGAPHFGTWLEEIARTRSSIVEVFQDFCRMSACALAAQTREEEYLEIADRYDRGELDKICRSLALLVNEMHDKPFEDVLGPYHQEIQSGSTRDARGEFYTPPCLSELMAKLVVGNVDEIIEKGRAMTVEEPAVGSGGMILQLAKQFAPGHVDLLRVTCRDISPTACDMTYVNTTLWGIPAHVIRGNTLTLKVDASWKNIHWHRVGEDLRRNLIRMEGPFPEVERWQDWQVQIESEGSVAEVIAQQCAASEQGEFDL